MWLANQYESEFYVVQAVLAVLAVIGLLWHMNGRWDKMASRGQRWRYYALAGFATQTAYESIELMELHIDVSFRHWLQLVVLCVLIAATYISIKDDHRATERPIP